MIPIPVEIDAVLSMLNLPKDMVKNNIFGEHRTMVLEMLKSIVMFEYYNHALHDDLPDDEPLCVAFRFGYAFLMLHSTVEFLNLKTLGEGIVKTVGLDQSATELLTGSEITAFKANLELRALTALREFLNPSGLDRLAELKPRLPKVLRAGVI